MHTVRVVSYAQLQLRGRAFNAFKTMHGLHMPVMQHLCRAACIENSSTFCSLLTTPINDVIHQVSITRIVVTWRILHALHAAPSTIYTHAEDL